VRGVKAKVVVSANCGMEPGNKVIPYKPLLDAAIELSEVKPQACIIYNREHELVSAAVVMVTAVSPW
jgi:propionyl-CoA synthetase